MWASRLKQERAKARHTTGRQRLLGPPSIDIRRFEFRDPFTQAMYFGYESCFCPLAVFHDGPPSGAAS